MRQRVEQLEKKLEQVEQRLEPQPQTARRPEAMASAPRQAEAPADPYVRRGLLLTSPDSDYQLRFRALLQVDYRDYLDRTPGSAVDTFVIRRARPILEGTVHEKFDFRIMVDFAGGQTQLMDAYADANLATEFKVRLGKFKPPVGLERLQSPADLLFAERAFPSDLVPNRDIGLQFSGEVLNRTLYYAAGVFDGAVDNSSINGGGDTDNGKDLDLRLFAQPFRNADRNWLRGIRLGLAYTRGQQAGTAASANLPTYVTPGQQNFFAYSAGAFANGERVTWAPQLYYSVGRFGLLGEYTTTRQAVSRAANTQDVANSAWQAALSWVVTGENATFRGVIPDRSFDFGKRQWGSLELVARVSQLTVDSSAYLGSAATQLSDPNTQASKATDYGIGLSWDLSRVLRVMLDYDQTRFRGGANGADRPDEKVIITRFQYSL